MEQMTSVRQNNSLQQQQKQYQHKSLNLKYQEIINKISIYPRYQFFLIFAFCCLEVLISFNTMVGSFVFMNPLFQCNGVQTKQVDACLKIQQCKITNNFTAVQKDYLYCQEQQIRATIQSIFAFGLAIGMVGIPTSGNILGRRNTLIITLIIGIIGFSVLYYGIQLNIKSVMIIGSMITGIFGSGIYILRFIITCDFLTEKSRQRSLLIYCSIWGLTQTSFYFLYNYMPEWNYYLLFLLLIPTIIITLLVICFKIESPVFAIFVKKDIQMFKEILRKLSFYNRISQDSQQQIVDQAEQIIEIISQNKKQETHLMQNLKKILKNRANFIMCLCLMLPLISFNLFYYGMQGSMERTGFNFGLSMLFVGLTQFVGYISASILTPYLRRKTGAIISIAFSSTVGILFLFQFVKQNQGLQTALAALARVGTVFTYSFILLLESQLLSVEIRATAISIIQANAQISRIIIPYIIIFFNNLGINFIIVSSILFIFLGAFPIILLKQTYQEQNKQNIQKQQIQDDSI